MTDETSMDKVELPIILAPPLGVASTFDEKVAKRFKAELIAPLSKKTKAA